MSTDSMDKIELGFRKAQHLEICANPADYSVEGTLGAGFDQVHFLHEALPELSEKLVDSTVEFLGSKITFPVFVSCMTGGSEGGYEVNRSLAAAAQELGVPVGMGSIRILFHDSGLFDQFYLKREAPDVPVLANIGGVQLRDLDLGELTELLKRLEVQAIVVHLNPGQELFQTKGDRDFRGVREGIFRLCDRSPVPVIVKETGFGIRPSEVARLLDGGVAYVDLAGAGGTNWIAVESYMHPEEEAAGAREFDDWGVPTALLLAALDRRDGRVLASGGIRNGVEAAKAVALGAHLAGVALPFVKAVLEEGVEGAAKLLERMKKTFRTVMVLTGSRNTDALRRTSLWWEPSFAARVASLKEADARSR